MEKFEIFINNIKRKVDPRIMSIIIFCLFGFFIIFSLQMTREFKNKNDLLEAEYNRSMYEMIGYIKNIDLQFTKLQVTSDETLTVTTLADIWRQSNLAKENLSNLPIAQNTLSSAEKFLAEVSDYAYVIMKDVLKGNEITDKQKEDIVKLSESSSQLFSITSNIFDQFNKGSISWDKAYEIGTTNFDSESVWSNIDEINKIFQDYEGLLYDGAFSEHVTNIEPKGLTGNVKTSEEAKESIINAFGSENIESIEYTGELNNNNLELYLYNVKLKDIENIRNVQVTKKEGKIYLILSDKNVLSQDIMVDDAIEIGLEFLSKLGIEDMEESYYYITENLVTINYAYKQDDVIIYPDLIKVKIALDNGEICSLETAGYIYNHETRINLNPLVTKDQAQNKINSNVDVKESRLVVIPSESRTEILCYEFEGSINEEDCLIYINANNLQEEKILMIINTPEGTLTM